MLPNEIRRKNKLFSLYLFIFLREREIGAMSVCVIQTEKARDIIQMGTFFVGLKKKRACMF